MTDRLARHLFGLAVIVWAVGMAVNIGLTLRQAAAHIIETGVMP